MLYKLKKRIPISVKYFLHQALHWHHLLDKNGTERVCVTLKKNPVTRTRTRSGEQRMFKLRVITGRKSFLASCTRVTKNIYVIFMRA